MKKASITLYIVVVVVMAAATIVEKYQGTEYVAENIYGSWWFCVLWALLVAAGMFYFVRQKVRRPSVVTLHLSFGIILAGALLTHLTAVNGIVHLRQGATVSHYLTPDLQEHELPFSICLQRFEVRYHEGTEAPSDYVSHITVDGRAATISMNHIGTFRGVRLYQSSYDDDLQGSILALNSDPWGIPVTYTGYGLLFLSLLWMLIDPHGTYRQLLRQVSARSCILVIGCWFCTTGLSASEQEPALRTLPQETAQRFCQLYVVYNDRVCPMETYALDFTKKLYGKRHYGDKSAEQVLTGFIFFYDDWAALPIANDKKAMGRQIAVSSLHSGRPLKVFPYTEHGHTTWYAPTDQLPDSMGSERQRYIREVFTLLNTEIQAGRYDVVNAYLDKMLLYQQSFGGQSLPSNSKVQAERLYNKVPFATLLFMVCLTLGLLSFLIQIIRPGRPLTAIQQVVLLLLFLVLSFCLALRWLITSHIPLSNGYETMLVLAWSVMLTALLMGRRFPIMLTFGFLLSGFFLLVSHISQMDPQITHLMPVLNSPLLTLHVSVIMMAYALLSLTFVCSVTALASHNRSEDMLMLSKLMLYPAITFLGIGIFVGAIWANVSWGNYWSWDPKETWALITLMVYAVPLHQRSLHFSPSAYHRYMALAFLTVLMTYFGVNYFLGGMHSYA